MRTIATAQLLSVVVCVGYATASDAPRVRPALSDVQQAELECAARNRSSGPSYVWVNVSNPTHGTTWSVVVESVDLNVANPLATIEVNDISAHQHLMPRYSVELLASARTFLARYTDSEISSQLTLKSQLGEIRAFIRSGDYWPRQEALAHALFERGFFPSRDDLTPHIYVSPSPCESEKESREFLKSLGRDALMPPNKLLETDAATPGRWRSGGLLASIIVDVASPAAGRAAQQPIR